MRSLEERDPRGSRRLSTPSGENGGPKFGILVPLSFKAVFGENGKKSAGGEPSTLRSREQSKRQISRTAQKKKRELESRESSYRRTDLGRLKGASP